MPNRKRSEKSKKKVVTRAAPDMEYLTLDEAGLEVRHCRKSLESWGLRGDLHLTRVGRRVLVSREELRRFMRSKTAR